MKKISESEMRSVNGGGALLTSALLYLGAIGVAALGAGICGALISKNLNKK